MTVVSITAATPADLTPIRALLRASTLPLDGLEASDVTLLVAREGEHVVGCAAVERFDGAALLRSVAVEPGRRGTGVGGRLTEAALALARRQGARRVYLLTTTAGDYFPRFGFEPVARGDVDPAVRRSVEFTTACPSTALAMRLELSHPHGA